MNKGKNINIELLRCIACYFVIVIHTWGTFRMEGGVFHTEVFVGGIVTRCAVPVFFMITGYVYSNRSSLAHKYKNFVFRVLLPVFLMTFFTAIILARGIHFFLDESQEYISVMEYIRLIVTGHASDTYLSFHFWYIEELITFYLLLPIMQFVLCDDERADRVRRFLLVIGAVAYFIVPAIELITGIKNINVYMPDGLMFVWYILLGYELSKYNLKKVGIYGLFLHWICIVAMSVLEYYLEYKAGGDIIHTFSANDSLLIVGSAVGLFVFVLSLNIPEGFHKGIQTVGKATLGIYIVHVVVYSVLYQLKITKLLDFMPVIVFCIIYSVIIFVASFVGIKILEVFLNMVKK